MLCCSLATPLHRSAVNGHLDICRLLVASNADVAARDRCRSPLRQLAMLLTPCVAAMAELRLCGPLTPKKARATWLHIFAASRNSSRAIRHCFSVWGKAARARCDMSFAEVLLEWEGNAKSTRGRRSTTIVKCFIYTYALF